MIAQSLFDQFSQASQKYKSGILRVLGEGVVWEIVLIDGRAVDVNRSDDRDSLELLDRLSKAGLIKNQEKARFAAQHLPVGELEEMLVKQKKLVPEQVGELRAHIAVDALFEIGRQQNIECEFFFVPVRDHKGPGINMNFGQFLLDVVEFSVDEERANKVFLSLKRGRILLLNGDIPDRLLPSEQLLLSSVEFPCSYEDMERTSMTRYERIEGMLSLLDQGVIELAGEENHGLFPDEDTDQLLSARDMEDEAELQLAREMALTRPGPEVLAEENQKKRTLASGRRRHVPTFADKILNLNYAMLEEEALQKVILGTNMIFLLVLLLTCLMGPRILDSWFQGLSEFTSALLSTRGTLK